MNASKYIRPLRLDVAQWADELDEDAREWFEERAAIYEYEAGMSRHDAEVAAQLATTLYLALR
ncbi:MAG: hypothetical protein ACOY6N_11540 [Pseudomonadota bacterium]